MATPKKNRKPHRVSFTGNSARYSNVRLKKYCAVADVVEASTKFTHTDSVQFNDNQTISIAHYGRLTSEVRSELSLLGKTLYLGTSLLAFGFDYDSQTPLLFVLSPKRLYIIPYQIQLFQSTVHKHPVIVEKISSKLPVQDPSYWTNRNRNNHRNVPPLINAIDPFNEGFDFD